MPQATITISLIACALKAPAWRTAFYCVSQQIYKDSIIRMIVQAVNNLRRQSLIISNITKL